VLDRKGYSTIIKKCVKVSPVAYTVYVYQDEIITKWQKEDIKGIPLPKKPATVNSIIICRQ
jgi:hypothetical protein